VVGATLIVYLVTLLALGAYAQRRARSTIGFLVGDRTTGGTVAAVGAAAASSSAWTLLGVSGAAYGWGLGALWLFPACVGGFALNWLLIAPALRRHGHESGALTLISAIAGPPEARGRRVLVAVAAVVVLFSLAAYVAAQLQGAGKTFETVFGLPPWQTVGIGALVVLAYTLLGGFVAVSLTDTVQGLVMAATAVALPLATLAAVGGPAGLVEGMRAVDVDGFASLAGPRPLPTAIGFAVGLLGIGLGYPGQPHVGKYFLAMKPGGGAMRRARVVALCWAVLVYAGMILLGLSARVLFPTLGDGEVVMVVAAERLFPAVIAGIMLAAVLSAIMSTADSQLLAAASILVHDLGWATTRLNTVLLTRATIALLTAVAAAAALVGDASIFERVLFGWAAMGASLGPLVLVRIVLRRNLGNLGALATVVVGAGLAVSAHLSYEQIAGTKDYRGVFIHVVPYVAATMVALGGSKR